MITYKLEIKNELFDRARNFEKFRSDCKEYLSKAKMNFDKFTVVSHDSFIGYITEYYVKKYLIETYNNIEVTSWEDSTNIRMIIEIVKNSDFSDESKNIVREYFYDKWDLSINNHKGKVLTDVKTALTKKIPNKRWNFLYPIIQANKPGKDIMILVYYIVSDIKDLTSLKELVIVGYTNYSTIKKCKIIKQGEKTQFGTISQIDNYITNLASDYNNIDKLFKND